MNTFAEIVRARVTDEHVGLRFGCQQWTWKEVVQEAAHRAASQVMCTIQPPCVTFAPDGSRVFPDSRADLGTRRRTGSDLTYRRLDETDLIRLNDEFAEHGRTMLLAAV